MNKPWVDIVIGSKSDEKYVEGATEVLEFCGVNYTTSIISAHRHEEQLTKHCKNVISMGAGAVIAGAGWAAFLPGAIASRLKTLLVFGVAIPSDEFPNAMDAILAIVRAPKGCCPTPLAGIGKSGFEKAALSVCLGLACGGDIVATSIKEKVAAYLKDRAGEPIDALEEKQEERKEE